MDSGSELIFNRLSYTPSSECDDLDESAVKDFLSSHQISVELRGEHKQLEGDAVFAQAHKPIVGWNCLSGPGTFLQTVHKREWARPTAVQAASWPYMLSGFDVLGLAETGSGKTLAYALTAFAHASARHGSGSTSESPSSLIIVPSRELAEQINMDFRAFFDMKHYASYGGNRVARIPRDAESLIGTPGRLQDLIRRRFVNLSDTSLLIVDEADRLLEDGFFDQAMACIRELPSKPNRQTLFWTATWPKEVHEAAKDIMPLGWVQINVGYTYMKANCNIRQVFWVCPNERQKNDDLKSLIADNILSEKKKAIVFTNTRKNVANLHAFLRSSFNRLKIFSLEGSMLQAKRMDTLHQFGGATGPAVLIATDVAQRGIHVSDVAMVINYDLPDDIESYTHRIGRTGRAGKRGDSYSFYTPGDDDELAPHLYRLYMEVNESDKEFPGPMKTAAQNLSTKRQWGGNALTFETQPGSSMGWGQSKHYQETNQEHLRDQEPMATWSKWDESRLTQPTQPPLPTQPRPVSVQQPIQASYSDEDHVSWRTSVFGDPLKHIPFNEPYSNENGVHRFGSYTVEEWGGWKA